MAQRRMFNIKILDSARFLKMPSSTQLLYFHLSLRADDDGIVEAFNVMRRIRSSDSDLEILSAKGYITILSEDLVSCINDWHKHNLTEAHNNVSR